MGFLKALPRFHTQTHTDDSTCSMWPSLRRVDALRDGVVKARRGGDAFDLQMKGHKNTTLKHRCVCSQQGVICNWKGVLNWLKCSCRNREIEDRLQKQPQFCLYYLSSQCLTLRLCSRSSLITLSAHWNPQMLHSEVWSVFACSACVPSWPVASPSHLFSLCLTRKSPPSPTEPAPLTPSRPRVQPWPPLQTPLSVSMLCFYKGGRVLKKEVLLSSTKPWRNKICCTTWQGSLISSRLLHPFSPESTGCLMRRAVPFVVRDKHFCRERLFKSEMVSFPDKEAFLAAWLMASWMPRFHYCDSTTMVVTSTLLSSRGDNANAHMGARGARCKAVPLCLAGVQSQRAGVYTLASKTDGSGDEEAQNKWKKWDKKKINQLNLSRKLQIGRRLLHICAQNKSKVLFVDVPQARQLKKRIFYWLKQHV